MDTVCIRQDELHLPHTLVRYFGRGAPEVLCGCGNLDVLQDGMLAMFCSVRCPGESILKTYDLARSLRDAGVTVISGFHSPMEKECLRILLRGTQPIVICPARSIANMRIKPELKEAFEQGRILFLSPFAEKHRRVTAALAQQRNLFVAAIADVIFIAHAAPNSRTEHFCRQIIEWNKPIWTVDDPENHNLINMGARPVNPDKLPEALPKKNDLSLSEMDITLSAAGPRVTDLPRKTTE